MDDNDNENILRESLKPLLASSFSVELIGRPRRKSAFLVGSRSSDNS